MAFNEVERFINKICRSVPPLDAVAIAPYPVGIGQQRIGIRTFPGGFIFIKAIIIDRRCIVHIATATHVPFTEMTGCITVFFQHTGH
ncbi:hypothetical protein SDC9_139006 [bioreactor metagenome]|uniref:Uncharacterized protein n=1 Tax=bioreactor metagenome TaxID=1076179 RepID=A0A645DTV9_9ZZZZ